MTSAIGLEHFLVCGSALFCLGLFVMMTRRNAIAILMGIELMLNAAGINFIAFARWGGSGLDGHIFVIFMICLAAAEAAIALAIVVGIFQNFKTITADSASLMKE